MARLELTADRLGMALGGRFNVNRPLRLLVYNSETIDVDEKNALLMEYYSVWDAIMVVEKDTIILNLSSPIANAVAPDQFKAGKILNWIQNPFVILLLLVVGSVPVPLGVNVLQTLINLDTFSKRA